MAPTDSLAGQMLLALPGIGDPRFDRAVIAICSHDPQGAIGIGVGHVMPRLGLHALLEQLGLPLGEAPDSAVLAGGPVEPQRGFVLHSPDWSGDGTVAVGTRWGLTGTLDILRAIADGSGPRRWLVALGYAGWGEGQLDGEMTRHGWFATPGDDRLLFEAEPQDRWQGAFAGAGVDVRLLTAASGHA